MDLFFFFLDLLTFITTGGYFPIGYVKIFDIFFKPHPYFLRRLCLLQATFIMAQSHKRQQPPRDYKKTVVAW